LTTLLSGTSVLLKKYEGVPSSTFYRGTSFRFVAFRHALLSPKWAKPNKSVSLSQAPFRSL
jgi:hypothetical protein